MSNNIHLIKDINSPQDCYQFKSFGLVQHDTQAAPTATAADPNIFKFDTENNSNILIPHLTIESGDEYFLTASDSICTNYFYVLRFI